MRLKLFEVYAEITDNESAIDVVSSAPNLQQDFIDAMSAAIVAAIEVFAAAQEDHVGTTVTPVAE